MLLLFDVLSSTFPVTARVCSKQFQEGTTMFEIIVFAGVVALVAGALGLGYPESTYARWNRH